MKKKLIKNLEIKILSLVLAVLLWALVMNISDPEESRTIENLPVTVINEDAIAEADKVYTIVSGDTVDITEEGRLLINGSVQDEEIFYPTQAAENGIDLPCEIPKDAVFLLCDFRTNGIDSRSYGPVNTEALDGKVVTVLRRRGI